jgi:hypothetical protein
MTVKKKKVARKFPSTKIRTEVGKIIPKGKNFDVYFSDSSLGKMKIVRIVTPAWKTLRPSDRIAKVVSAINPKLTKNEQDRILRFSVLTPDEYESIFAEAAASS